MHAPKGVVEARKKSADITTLLYSGDAACFAVLRGPLRYATQYAVPLICGPIFGSFQ